MKLMKILTVVLLAAGVVNAESTTFGPIPDFKGFMDVPMMRTIDTWIGINAPIPFDGRLKIGRPDRITVQITVPVPIFAATYIKVETSAAVPFNRETDEIVLTDVWAVDLQPGLDPCEVPLLTGFNPASPEMVPLSFEEFIGLSGTVYSAVAEAFPLGMLPLLLPEYDLEKFMMQGNPSSMVYVAQRSVPAVDFIDEPAGPLDFSFLHRGYITQDDPGWVGGKNPEYPYQHYWELIIHNWGDVEYVSDVDIEEPWVIYPGYIEVVPPSNWHSTGVVVGRYGYEANPGAELSAGGGSLGIEWRVNGKVPAVVPGHVVLTQRGVPISDFKETMIVASEEEPQEFDFSFDYLGCVHVGGEYPYLHSWALNIRQWNPAVPMVTDVEVEGPSIIPGYVKVIPPENWSVIPITVGRYGYEANPTDPIVNEGRYTDFRVEAKTPYVEPGQVHLTENGQPVSPPVETVVVGPAPEEEPTVPSPYIMLDTYEDWAKAMEDGRVKGVVPEQWESHMMQWEEFDDDDKEPYPSTTFGQAELYLYEGDPQPESPNDAGLVMWWGNGEDGDFASAWQLKPPQDPDLTNCTITVTVTAPQFAMGTSGQVNQVSLALQNAPMVGGPMRAWYWKCGPVGGPDPIWWNTPTTITIDTSKTGVTAATPTATNYANNPAFNLKTVMFIALDENGTWVGGPTPAPGPGGPPVFLWNYWHWLMITPNTQVSKGYYTKWSQPPTVVDPAADPPVIIGWDELSDYHQPPMVADDWPCKDERPITDIHWWGSFIGWTQPHPPPILPKAFHLGIWTDVPVDPADPDSFSHPGVLIWENYCDNWVWNFAGYDRDPRMYPPGMELPNEPGFDVPMDACFQFNQLLSQDEWFYQQPNDDPDRPRIYWLSIAPIYNPWDYDDPNFYPWGWKTRRPEWNDDAVRILRVSDASGLTHWPPAIGSLWNTGTPIKWPEDPPDEAYSWDVAFELTTNEPGPPNADLNNDGIVNFRDLAILADQWLTVRPRP